MAFHPHLQCRASQKEDTALPSRSRTPMRWAHHRRARRGEHTRTLLSPAHRPSAAAPCHRPSHQTHPLLPRVQTRELVPFLGRTSPCPTPCLGTASTARCDQAGWACSRPQAGGRSNCAVFAWSVRAFHPPRHYTGHSLPLHAHALTRSHAHTHTRHDTGVRHMRFIQLRLHQRTMRSHARAWSPSNGQRHHAFEPPVPRPLPRCHVRSRRAFHASGQMHTPPTRCINPSRTGHRHPSLSCCRLLPNTHAQCRAVPPTQIAKTFRMPVAPIATTSTAAPPCTS